MARTLLVYKPTAINKTEIYVRASSRGKVNDTVMANIFVGACGGGYVNGVPFAQSTHMFTLTRGTGNQTLTSANFTSLFTLTNSSCPITKFEVYPDNHESEEFRKG